MLTGALVRGAGVQEAVAQAGDFVRCVIERSVACGAAEREGVQLERSLQRLIAPEPPEFTPRFIPVNAT